MKKRIVQLLVGVISLGLGGSAVGQVCDPKDLKGHIELIHRDSVAVAIFQEQGCAWAETPDLNGSDGLVLDVSDLRGSPARIAGTLVQGRSLLYVVFKGYFIDPQCDRIPDSDIEFVASLETAPKLSEIEIPEQARWLAIDRTDGNPTNDASISLHSDDKSCDRGPRRKRSRSD